MALAAVLVAAPVAALAQANPAPSPPPSPAQPAPAPATSQPDASTPAAAQAGGAAAAPASFAEIGAFALSATITADLLGDPAGGVAQGLKLLTKTALVASYDGGQSGHPGWSGLVSLQYVKGGHISGTDVGDLQRLDNIEAIDALRVYEVWAAKSFADGKASVKLGFTDLNVDFDTQQVAALFLNSSDGVGAELGASGVNGPSIFPTPALAVSGFWKPDDNWTLRAGLFDGTAGSPYTPNAFFALRLSGGDGVLGIAQAERRIGGAGRVELGGWAYSTAFDAPHRLDANGDPQRLHRGRGVYALVEGPVLGDGNGRSLSGWVRAGFADPVVEPISFYLGAGVVASGISAKRPEDQAGIGISHAAVDDPSVPSDLPAVRRAETAIELTYKAQLKDWLSVQPDAQLVIRPSGDPHIPTAFVIGARLNIALTRESVRAIRAVPDSLQK